jgi:hypothetical protein
MRSVIDYVQGVDMIGKDGQTGSSSDMETRSRRINLLYVTSVGC